MKVQHLSGGTIQITLTREEAAHYSVDRSALVVPKANTFAEKVIKSRVPCAYGSATCAGIRFAPNGVGSKQHTTCEKGRAAMKAARA